MPAIAAVVPFSQCNLRSLVGRLSSTPGVKLDDEYSSISRGCLGCKSGTQKKLAALYGDGLAATLAHVAEAEIGYTAKGARGKEPLVGRLAIPSAATLLKQDFGWYAKKRGELAFSPGREFTLIDRHDDQSRAWLVRDADGSTSVHVAEVGHEGDSRRVADDLDGYLELGLSCWFLTGWHREEQRATLREQVAALKAVARKKDVVVEVLEKAPVDAEGLSSFVAKYLEDAPQLAKPLKARATAIRKLGPVVRVRLRIQSPDASAFIPRDRVAAVLADAPGAEAFLAACGPSDPRFDWLWNHGYANSHAPAEFLGANYVDPLPEEGGPVTFRADCVLCESMVAGLQVGTRFEATRPYS